MSLPVTAEPLPTSITFGKVVGRVIHLIADTAEDTDDKPQARAAAGKVTFTPKEVVRRTTEADYPAIVLHAPEEATLSATGRILDAEGRQGIWLATGVYSVTFTLDGGKRDSIPSFDVAVTAEHTDAAPLDLAKQVPYVPPSGTTVQTVLIPSGGTTGQVLVRTATGTLEWADQTADVDLTGYVTDQELTNAIAAIPDPDLSGYATTTALSDGLSTKVNRSTYTAGLSDNATADRDRANHTGTQSLDTTTDSATRLAMTAAERTKLGGVAAGATAYTDEQVRDVIGATIVTGAGLSKTVDDDGNIVTLAAIGGTGDGLPAGDPAGSILVSDGTSYVPQIPDPVEAVDLPFSPVGDLTATNTQRAIKDLLDRIVLLEGGTPAANGPPLGVISSSTAATPAPASTLDIAQPTGLVDGAVIYLAVSAWSDDSAAQYEFSFSAAGFTADVPTMAMVGDLSAGQVAILRKVVTTAASEPATYTVAAAAQFPVPMNMSVVAVAVQGTDLADPTETVVFQKQSSTSVTAPTLTPTVAGSLLLWFAFNRRAVTVTYPSGMTGIGQASSSGGSIVSNLSTAAAAWEALPTTAATGERVGSIGGTARENVGINLLVRPA